MTDKLTDEQIIKALECCDNSFCEDCPYKPKLLICREELCHDTIDLINRQKAEIERLGDCNRRLKDDMRMMLNNDNGSEQIKSEAIKEFAERLKEKATSSFYEERKYVDTEDIDDLVKEMTEGEAE